MARPKKTKGTDSLSRAAKTKLGHYIAHRELLDITAEQMHEERAWLIQRMIDVEGYTLVETAEILGISEPRVRQLRSASR